jgi:hypothetical protein
MRSGLIGTSSIQLGFQNGWRFTSLNGSSDNMVAETLASVASIFGAVKDVGGGAGSGTTGGGGGHATGGAYVPQAMPLPELYAFDNSPNSVLGLCVAQALGQSTDGQLYGQISDCNDKQAPSGTGGKTQTDPLDDQEAHAQTIRDGFCRQDRAQILRSRPDAALRRT